MTPLRLARRAALVAFALACAALFFARGLGAQTLPDPWAALDVGTSEASGATCFDSEAFSVPGGGELWYSRDAFHFARRPLAEDGSIAARLASRGGAAE